MAEKDFIGFTFDGKHSDELGILRVSGGDKYKEELQPEIKDISSEVPGMDGEYYFGSNYGKKEISIDIAYDSLTETQLRGLRRLFSGREIHELIFDERPYKKYLVKLSGPIELDYICFEEQKKADTATIGTGVRVVDRTNGVITREKTEVYEPVEGIQRIYKGEGTINLVAYFPFAKSVYRELPEGNKVPENIDEWKDSCGILDSDTRINYKIDQYYQDRINIYNGGDLNTGFRLYCPFNQEQVGLAYNGLGLTYKMIEGGSTKVIAELRFKSESIAKIGEDEGFLIDTNSGLVVGVKDFIIPVSGNAFYSTTGNLYNQYIESGYFFKLKPNLEPNESYIEVSGGNEYMKIFYDYLYF